MESEPLYTSHDVLLWEQAQFVRYKSNQLALDAVTCSSRFGYRVIVAYRANGSSITHMCQARSQKCCDG